MKAKPCPLKKQGTVAVIGPLANTGANMPGTWSVSADHANTQTLVDGMKEVLGKQVNITSHLGANLSDDAALQERSTMFGRTIPRDDRDPQLLIEEALQLAQSADVIVAALGRKL